LHFAVCFSLRAVIPILTLHTTILVRDEDSNLFYVDFVVLVVFLDSLACSEIVYKSSKDHEFSSWGYIAGGLK